MPDPTPEYLVIARTRASMIRGAVLLIGDRDTARWLDGAMG